MRHGASLPYADVRTRCETTPHLLRKGPGFVLYALMDFVVDHYFPIVDELRGEAREPRGARSSAAASTARRTEQIYDLKRDLLGLKRAVSPLVDVCNRLVRFDVGLIPEDTRPYFRDVYDHVIRINETVDNLRELLTTALEANLSLISVGQNEVTKKLAGVGRHPRRADDDRRRLRHELRVHAGAALALRLPVRHGRHGRPPAGSSTGASSAPAGSERIADCGMRIGKSRMPTRAY